MDDFYLYFSRNVHFTYKTVEEALFAFVQS